MTHAAMIIFADENDCADNETATGTNILFMLRIYLVRHGETEENRNNVLQGQTPGHLTELGKEQASALGEKLGSVVFDAVVSSPLQRAVDTTRIILGKWHANEIETCPLLMERDWGSLTLCTYAEARSLKKFPPDVETLEAGMERARRFVNLMFRRFDGKTILCVGHGFIDRCILAEIQGTDRNDIPRMENAECRVVEVNGEIRNVQASASPDEVSAN